MEQWGWWGGILTTRYPAPALAPDSDAELTAVHFTMTEDGTPVSRDIPVGFYTVTFSFYNDATQDEAHKLFSCSQTINIYKNLETNWWKNSTAGATYISNQSGTFTLSPDVIRRYARHNFYVDPQRGSDTNAGSWYDPFDSVKTAVKKICNTNDGEPYTVSLLSDDTDASGDAYISEDNAAYINIDPAAALTLTILGRDDNDGNVLRTINAARTAGTTGRVMFIGSKATVTLSNIGITGGYASDNGGGNADEQNGGGISNCGTLTMTDCTITGCTATGSGGGIYNDASSTSVTAKITKCTITGCRANGTADYNYGGGGIYNNVGTIELTDCKITGGNDTANPDAYCGGGIYNKGALTVTGGTISGNKATSGGGIYSYKGSTLTMESGAIIGNGATSSGGGVYNNGTFIMNGGRIGGTTSAEANTANNGGGIGNGSDGAFTMTGGEITGNTATKNGGGVYGYGGTFKFESGTISGNTAGGTLNLEGGGGVFNYCTKFTMTGGTISGNKVEASGLTYGGGVFQESSTFTMTGGTIIGNEANCGGGVNVYSGTFKFEGGTIGGTTPAEANKASSGGGVNNYRGTFEMSGTAVISGNTATGSGGGVYTGWDSFAKSTITGGTISGNTASRGGGVCVANKSSATIENIEINCTATSGIGNGIYIFDKGSCTLDGCVVQNSTSSGYAVYVGNSNTSTAVLNVKGAAKIIGAGNEAEKIYLYSPKNAVVITGGLTENPVAKINSKVYTTAPAVLKDNTDDKSLVKAHYAQFQSDHAGYSIYDDGVLRLPPTEGGVVTEEHTCTFSLDKTEITASGDRTLTVTATVTTTGQDGTTQKTFSGADLNWAAIKVFCGLHEITQADFSRFSVDGGIVTIPSDMWDEAYSVQAAGTYTCENGCKKAFAGQIPFAVRRNAVPEGFVWVNGGTVSGSGHPDIPDSAGSEHKGVFIAGRTVTLSPYMMCDHEVTQGEWEEVMAGNADGVTTDPSSCKAGSTNYAVNFGTEQKNRPVESMTWYDAVYYCNERSKKEGLTPVYDISGITVSSYGKITAATVTLVPGGGIRPNGYRLPTEAEWEFAARGGDPNSSAWNCLFSGAATASGTAYSAGVNSGLDSVGWYIYNNKTGTTTADSQTATSDGKGTHEVKQKAANSLGLYDMSGNVWEWCWDRTGTVSTGSETDPTGASSESTNRVCRGGAWDNYAYYPNVCRRNALPPGGSYTNIGLRVVRSVSQ